MATNQKKLSKSERAQALMRQQQRRERRRNLLVVGSVVLAVLIIAAVLFFVQSKSDTTGKSVTASGTPKNLSGQYDVVIGKSSAPHTIKLYEDLQCPICQEFEKAAGDQVRSAIADGKVKVDYHMVAFLDRESSTNYSSRALNAAMAVLSTAGPQGFLKFHEIAYDNQPAEGSAGVPDSTLVDWAVQAGADKAKVTPLIDGNVYHQWVVNATDQMSKDKVTGTPTIFIDGTEETNLQTGVNAVLQITK
ncbi:MAG TPA: thioredoxin domain-containing protein [Nocardioides sp.]|uniref:DsbA family protein n=1 Tax=Nocardioides sp. TaxID=35761 RepID=UPI002F40E771